MSSTFHIRLRRASKTLVAGDELHLYYDARVLESIPTPPQLIADQEKYSIWYKPYGLLSQGSKHRPNACNGPYKM